MKIGKTLFFVLTIAAIGIICILAAIFFYLKYYGDALITENISKMLGTNIKFEHVSVDISKYSLRFQGFSLPGKTDFSDNVFNARTFVAWLDKEKFEKERKIVFKEIRIEKGELNLERNRQGIIDIPMQRTAKKQDVSVFAPSKKAEPVKKEIFNIPNIVQKLVIKDFVVNFHDAYISRRPLVVTLTNCNASIVTKPSADNYLPLEVILKLTLPSRRYEDGDLLLEGDIFIHSDRANVDMVLETRNIDLMQFAPYLEHYTPFSVKEGNFSSDTTLSIYNNTINSLTTMTFHRLYLEAGPAMRTAQFLESSVDKLLPYLMSGSGDVIFDFVVKGPVEKPEAGLGPRVKFAIGRVVIEELGSFIRQLQQLQQK